MEGHLSSGYNVDAYPVEGALILPSKWENILSYFVVLNAAAVNVS
jgi:hypothetical protein